MLNLKYILATSVIFTIVFSSTVFGAVYSDISGHPYEKYISEYSEKGYVSGYPDGTFRPNNTITRAEVAALIKKINLPEIKQQNNMFSDVSLDDWFYDAVDTSVKGGIISGYEGNIFKPQNNITRFEIISILSNLIRSENYNTVTLPYIDTEQIPTWVNNAVRNLYACGIIGEYDDNKIDGNKNISRGEVIAMLSKIMEKSNWDTTKVAQETLNNVTNPLPKDTEIPHDKIGYLTINSIGIENFPIEDGADLTTIKKAIGHFSETPVWDGNVGLCAHNRDYRYDFRNLKNISIGDEVIYKTRFGERTYKVNMIKPIEETDWSEILTAKNKNCISMVTCIEEQPTKRLLVQAVQE